MDIEVLLSTMNLRNKEELINLIRKMNIKTNVLIINQITEKIPIWNYEEGNIRLYSYLEKGLSKSRNKALDKAKGEILIFADDDIQYKDNYAETILNAYNNKKDADIIAFNIETVGNRKARKQKSHKINWITAMQIQSTQITLRKNFIDNINIRFNELFGSGSIYTMGEENIFLYDCLKEKRKLYCIDKDIGKVIHKKSNWFKGYTNNFFISEGAVFYEISKKFYIILIIQYAIRKRKLYKTENSFINSIKYMLKGATSYARYKKLRGISKYNSSNI